MSLEIGIIVWKRIDGGRFYAFEEDPVIRSITRGETGGIRLEFYHQCHNIDV